MAVRKLGLLILGTACVLSPATSLRAAAAWDETASIHGLTKALVALSPTVSPEEAQVLSVTVHEMSLQLAREYGVNGDPAYHNFLINIGKAQRGYCAHYCRDMGMKLRTMQRMWRDARRWLFERVEARHANRTSE